MKGLKIIAALSFILIFYPILAVPVKYKEWMAAIFAFVIFAVSLALIYIFSEDEMEASAEDSEDRDKSKDNNKHKQLAAKASKDD